MSTTKLPDLTTIDGQDIRLNLGVLEAVDHIYVSLNANGINMSMSLDLNAAEEFANILLGYIEQHRRTMARRVERTSDNLNAMFNNAL